MTVTTNLMYVGKVTKVLYFLFLDALASLKTMFKIKSVIHNFKVMIFQEYYRVLKSISESYRVLQNNTEYYRVLQSITECYRVLEIVTGY